MASSRVWAASSPYHLWLHVARLREANGDTEGAARARRTARMLPGRRFRRACGAIQRERDRKTGINGQRTSKEQPDRRQR